MYKKIRGRTIGKFLKNGKRSKNIMRDKAIDLCGQVDFTRTAEMPLLGRQE